MTRRLAKRLNCSIMPPKTPKSNSYHIPDDSPQLTLFRAWQAATYIRYSQVPKFLNYSLRFDFSSVEGRRQAVTRLDEFVNEFVEGDKLFGIERRFVDGIPDLFVSSTDGGIYRCMVQMQSALTVLRDIVAKDTQVGETSTKASSAQKERENRGDMEMLTKQELQDAKKSFDEARNSMLKHLPCAEKMDRQTFERTFPWSD